MKRTRTLLVLLAVVVGLMAVADFGAKAVAQRELAQRAQARAPGASGATAYIHSFPFLPRLLGSGHVSGVDVRVRDVEVEGLRFASITVDLAGVKLDRRQLLDERRVVLEKIDRGTVRAEIEQEALAKVFGVDIVLEDGRASVTVAGRRLTAQVAVRNGRLVVDGAGVSLPALSVVAPFVPCVPDAAVRPRRLVLTCQFTEVPEELKVVR